MKRKDQSIALDLLRRQALCIEKLLSGEWSGDKAKALGEVLIAQTKQFVDRYP